MNSPLRPPEGNWWGERVNRREAIYLGLVGGWSVVLMGWMAGFSRFGRQNPVGETHVVDREEFRDRVAAYKDAAESTDLGLVPPGDDVYIMALRFHFDGLPVVLEADRQYNLRLSSYDIQHGLSFRPKDTLSKQMNLQILPDVEWVLPMAFDQPGEYFLQCNEFCGRGHEAMHGSLHVQEA